MITLYAKQKETQMYWTDFWTLWEKARVGCFERTASKHVHYLGWNRSPAQVGCMRQMLGPGALGRRRGIGWRGRWEGESGWGAHVNPWQIHVNVWQKPLQYCKVISFQLIKINEKKPHSFIWFLPPFSPCLVTRSCLFLCLFLPLPLLLQSMPWLVHTWTTAEPPGRLPVSCSFFLYIVVSSLPRFTFPTCSLSPDSCSKASDGPFKLVG